MRVMFVVTHLLGTGHLSRVLTLADAFLDAGHEPLVVSGGFPTPHLERDSIRVRHLPPLRSDGTNFSRLLTPDGEADDSYHTSRKSKLLDALADFRPDVLITELFPFGRRNLKAEFQTLLNGTSGKTLVLSSIRDVLAPPGKASKLTFANEMIASLYDGVLVHSDPELIPLHLSWPVSESLARKLHYTGFVAQRPMEPVQARQGILVSTGGGAVGDKVFEAAIDAAALAPDLQWTLVVGGVEDRVNAFAKAAPMNVSVQGLVPDFRSRLAIAEASVSLVGYNTAMDLLQSGTPGVLVPFDAGNEVEQSIRANALSDLSALEVVPETHLSGPRLLNTLRGIIAKGTRLPRHENMDGASRSVEVCESLLRRTKDV